MPSHRLTNRCTGPLTGRLTGFENSGKAVPSNAINSALPAISGTGIAGNLHTGTDGTWTGAVAYERRWRLDGLTIGTGSSVTPNSAGSLVFQVRGRDSLGNWSSWVSSAPKQIGQAPVNIAAPVLYQDYANNRLAVSDDIWTNAPTSKTFTFYEWNEGGSNWVQIDSGPNPYSYASTTFGKLYRVGATATNIYGSSPIAYSASIVCIQPTVPLWGSVLVDISFYDDTAFAELSGSAVPGPILETEYQWRFYADGWVVISGAALDELDVESRHGQTISVGVRQRNLKGWSDWRFSTGIVVPAGPVLTGAFSHAFSSAYDGGIGNTPATGSFSFAFNIAFDGGTGASPGTRAFSNAFSDAFGDGVPPAPGAFDAAFSDAFGAGA